MALSNWDTFSINEKGNPCNGIFTSPSNISVEIYKNWIYIRDKIVVLEIYDSELRYKDINIVSTFKNNGIYIITWSGYDEKMTGMIGCGVNGFDGKGNYVGVTKKHVERLKSFLNRKTRYYNIPETLKNLNLEKGKRFNQGDMFFHDNINTDTQCSEIGKAKEPILSKALRRDDK